MGRLLEFIDDQGGFYKAGDKAGVPASTFYAMRDRGTVPSSKTLLKILGRFENLDLNVLFRGRPSLHEQALQREIDDLKRRVDELSCTNTEIISMVERLGKRKTVASSLPKIVYLLRRKSPRLSIWLKGLKPDVGSQFGSQSIA